MSRHPLQSIVSLAKRRGFIYPGSDLYGGFANTYSFGPYGAQLKKNIKDLWWRHFVEERTDIVGLDGPILLHPRVWQASGHVDGFSDALVDCKQCKSRFRADHLLEAAGKFNADTLPLQEMDQAILDLAVECPHCKKREWTLCRHFNLMFTTQMSKVSNTEGSLAYLRPETAQAIFIDFKNILDTMRVKLPFGIAQIGKAFRNEITPGNFIFRVIEFEQMEIEYFIDGAQWEKNFEVWLESMHTWCRWIGLRPSCVHEKEHPKEQLSHYSKRTVDLVYDFPFGTSELYGLAYRSDYDLRQHEIYSHQALTYTDPETKAKYLPHVIEPTFGVERTLLALLCDAFDEESLADGSTRSVLRFLPRIAPVKAAVFPLMKKEPLTARAQEIFSTLRSHFVCEYDASGAIGKRYRRQDELGTPYCITIDFDTLQDGTVTVRDRDTMEQIRLADHKILSWLQTHLSR
jgi:glycyl-tRNA synthetase